MALCGIIKHHDKNEKPCVLGFWHFLTSERIAGFSASLSAIKGVNQAFARFTPFFTPKNVKLGVFVFFKILQKNVNYKAIGISMDWQNEPL